MTKAAAQGCASHPAGDDKLGLNNFIGPRLKGFVVPVMTLPYQIDLPINFLACLNRSELPWRSPGIELSA
ncbi:MAG: hypothetical protein IPP37_14775 [Saprospiraceae bacterium]|nr:hypothetical protein [Saprospiraceae bacterium]